MSDLQTKLVPLFVLGLAMFGMAAALGLAPGWFGLFAEKHKVLAILPPSPDASVPVAAVTRPQPDVAQKSTPDSWCAGAVVGGFCVLKPTK